MNQNKLWFCSILIPIQLTSLFFTLVSVRLARYRSVVFVTKFVEVLQTSCEGEKNGCCVLCGREYCESYVWP